MSDTPRKMGLDRSEPHRLIPWNQQWLWACNVNRNGMPGCTLCASGYVRRQLIRPTARIQALVWWREPNRLSAIGCRRKGLNRSAGGRVGG